MLKYSIAAVALAACSSLAIADQMDRGDRAGGGNSAVEHAPGQMKGGSGSAKDFAPGQMKGEGNSAKDFAPGQTKKDHSASGSEDKSRRDKQSENFEGRKDSDSGLKGDRDDKMKNARSDRNDKMKNEHARDEASPKDRSSTGASEGTEGRGDSKGSIANVTGEQKTRVKSVFMQHRVEPARNLNVSVNVGVALPHTVHLYPVPEDIIVIAPEYRGYEYIMLDDDRVAIVDPDTFEVVDIIVIA